MVDPVAFTISIGDGAITKDIYWYGIIIAVGMILGLLVAIWNAKKLKRNLETFIDFSIFAVIFAVIGARVHYVVWSWELFKDQPLWKIFAVWEGGMAIYGGIIGGFIAGLIFSKVKKVPFLQLFDLAVPSLILGQAIGRWGNFVNQEAYGYPIFNEKYWHFPFTVFIQETGQYHLAAFFYESMWNLIGFFILMISLRKAKREGKTFFLYMIIYGVGRVIIEGIRTDSQMFLDTAIRINQVYSAIFIVVGGALYLFYRNAREYALNTDPENADNKNNRTRIKVKKVRPVDMSSEKLPPNKADEYKAMTEEMRRQREKSVENKE